MGVIDRPLKKRIAWADAWLGSGKGPQKILTGILLLGFFLRVYVCFFTHLPHMHRDSLDYFKQSGALLAGGYINYFPNGYPFIVALFQAMGGDHAIALLLWLNILLSTLTLYFVHDMGKRIFGHESIGLMAAFIVAVFPTQLNYVRWLMSEVPTAFFLLGAYYFYYRDRKLLSGLLFGFATVVRTDEAPVFILLLVAAAIYRKRMEWRLLAGALLPILLTGTYCYLKTGNFSVAGHGKVNILYSITASGGYVDWYFQDHHPEVKTTGQAIGMYMDHVRNEPGEFIRQRLANLWELWGFYPSSSDGNRGWASRAGIGLCNAFMLFFGIYAWWKNRRSYSALILLIPFLVVTPLHSLLLALPRYTYPVEPFMILLASWTLHRIIRSIAPHPSGLSATHPPAAA